MFSTIWLSIPWIKKNIFNQTFRESKVPNIFSQLQPNLLNASLQYKISRMCPVGSKPACDKKHAGRKNQ
jgi:hypothetical protein